MSDTAAVNWSLRALSLAWFTIKRPLLRRRLGKTVLEHVRGRAIVVLPEVHNPVVFRSGEMLANAVASAPIAAPRQSREKASRPPRALDMGTGTGSSAVFAAERGYDVIAVDINPEAVRCAQVNASLNRLEERIQVRHGDLFEPVAGERFDLVLFNPPFFRGESKNLLDHAWRSPDTLERFAAGLPSALADEGLALILLSTDGEGEQLLEALRDQGFLVATEIRKNLGNEILTLYSVRRRD